jgi:hypothetical protein
MPTPDIDVLKHQIALWDFAFLCWNLTTYGVAGNGRIAGRSNASNTERREPGSFWNGRSFSSTSSGRMAAFNSSRLKKR